MSALFKSKKTNDALMLIRGYHLAQTIELSPKTVEYIYGQIENIFKESVTLSEVASQKAQPQIKSKDLTKEETYKAPLSIFELQNKIRVLIASDAKWTTLLPYIQDWLSLEKYNPQICAKTIELAFLNTDKDTAYAFYKGMIEHQKNFYFKIHPDIRNILVLKKLKEKSTQDVFHLLYKSFKNTELLDSELYLLFRNMLDIEQHKEAADFYKKHEDIIWKVSKKHQKHIDISPSKLAIKISLELASEIDMGVHQQILKRVRFDDPEYSQAKKLLKHLQKNHVITPSAFEEIEQQLKVASYSEKISLINSQFREFTEKEIPISKNHPTQKYLMSFDKWLPKDFENYKRLSMLIVNNIDAIEDIYAIEYVLIELANRFQSKDLNIAFWSNLATDQVDPYWRGIALAHLYSASTTENNMQRLWLSRTLIHRTHHHKTVAYPSWKRAHQLLLESTKANKEIDVKFKEERLRQILVASHEEDLQVNYISSYINSTGHIPAETAKDLAKIAEKRSLKDIQLNLLRKQVFEYSLTNKSLDNLWIKCGNQNSDLAWRVGTIISSRRSTKKNALYAWQVSGENRATYNFSKIGLPTLEKLLEGLHRDERNFIKAMFVIGPHLPLVFSLISKNHKKVKYSHKSEVGLDLGVQQHLKQQVWYQTPKAVYASSTLGFDFLSHRYPAFYKVPSENTWAKTFTYLLDYLGGYSWKWNIDELQHQINIAMPLSESNKNNVKLGNWYKGLRSEQKKSWAFLHAKAGDFSSNEIIEKLILFACKLTTCMYPAHVEALLTLQKSRLPFLFLREFECWLISDNYTQLRKSLKVDNKMSLPQNLVNKSILLER